MEQILETYWLRSEIVVVKLKNGMEAEGELLHNLYPTGDTWETDPNKPKYLVDSLEFDAVDILSISPKEHI